MAYQLKLKKCHKRLKMEKPKQKAKFKINLVCLVHTTACPSHFRPRNWTDETWAPSLTTPASLFRLPSITVMVLAYQFRHAEFAACVTTVYLQMIYCLQLHILDRL